MSTRPDLDRSISAWLVSEAPDHAPAHLLAASRERVRVTRQRPAWWPPLHAPGSIRTSSVALTTAAVVAVAVLGLAVLSEGVGIVGRPGVPAATPSPSASPSPSPSPVPSAGDAWLTGFLDAGRHDAIISGVPFSFNLPTGGWRTNQYAGMIELGTYPFDDYRWIGFGGTIQSVATDPCAGTSRPVGQTVDDIAAALGTIPGIDATEPQTVTVGGRAGKSVVLTLNAEPACNLRYFSLFGSGSAFPNTLQSTIRIWIVDIGGQPFVVHTDQAAPDPEITREIQQIVDSIEFD